MTTSPDQEDDSASLIPLDPSELEAEEDPFSWMESTDIQFLWDALDRTETENTTADGSSPSNGMLFQEQQAVVDEPPPIPRKRFHRDSLEPIPLARFDSTDLKAMLEDEDFLVRSITPSALGAGGENTGTVSLNDETKPVTIEKVVETQADPEALLERELAKLSMSQKEQAFYDVQGITEVVEETDSLLLSSLTAFEKELQEVYQSHSLYKRALGENEAYIKNPQLRLKFLRADRFRPKLAAARFIRFLEFKNKIFGAEWLTKDPKLKDLCSNPDDKACLESGLAQILPTTDRAGRTVFVWLHPLSSNFRDQKAAISRTKMGFYIMMAAMENEDAQKRGTIAVIDNSGPDRDPNVETHPQYIGAMLNMWPFRVEALHYIYDHPGVQPAMVNTLSSFDQGVRVRFKPHKGTLESCKLELMTFGIPVSALPYNQDTKTYHAEYHREWLQERAALEASPEYQKNIHGDGNNTLPIGFVPGVNDVLPGRSKVAKSHVGNVRYEALLDEHEAEYEAAKKNDKTDISMAIVHSIFKVGGRFLKKTDQGWTILSEHEAHNKVSNAYRDRRKKYRKNHEDHSPVRVEESSNTPPEDVVSMSTKRQRD